MNRIALTSLFTCLALAVVYGQEAAPATGPSGGYGPAIAYSDSGFSWLDHSSTSTEGALRGAGAYAEGVGKANYYNSLSAMNYQEAYRRAIENSVNKVEARYARRDLWYDHQERYRRKPLDMEGYQKLASSRSPDRLSTDQYDPQTGQITWTYPLDAAVFKSHRETVQQLLGARSADTSGWGSRNYDQIHEEIEAMKGILEAGRDGIDSNRYIHALRFLEQVDWEARFAPSDEVLTSLQN
ncbi:hypothetical protein FF011L_13200 [Roseimaritima multifibrata]|uniref:Uncharacterized protein n=1 Tax=Roseimaritima multifibrata TaxID=1930274 RepID=A0A517MCE9_9BACT|nr:hypothetical protein [Roseimaritima multifibrata]QDS92573.1 hypothetical protein FF011L_13200 [Roseimaritima multifibrata]